MDHASLTTLESMNQAMWYNRWTLVKFAEYLLRQKLIDCCMERIS